MNDYLQTGLPLQNLLGSLMVWNRLKPVALCGDFIKQAFLQERIREADGDTFRFQWIRDKNSLQDETLRFMPALFGLVQSLFLFAGTLKQHLETSRTEYSKHVEEIMRSLYVDDIITGEDTVDQKHEWRRTAIEVFYRARFEFHKWNSNVPDLEAGNQLTEDSQKYAKKKLGA